jgi:UDP-glucose 4-epimerase
LLTAAYAKFVGEIGAGKGRDKLNPSGYVETQGAFTERFAAAMRPRLGLECAIELAKQTDFSEPLMRINVDSAARYIGGWNEAASWDDAAEGYRT